MYTINKIGCLSFLCSEDTNIVITSKKKKTLEKLLFEHTYLFVENLL